MVRARRWRVSGTRDQAMACGAQRRRRREWHTGGACRSRAPGGVAVQSDDVQGGDVQRMAVSPLGELRPRPSWYVRRSRAVREELQYGGCRRIRTGGVEPRVGNVGDR
jgi:hypothetical protein